MRFVIHLLLTALTFTYPLLVWYALTQAHSAELAWVLVAIGLLRLLVHKPRHSRAVISPQFGRWTSVALIVVGLWVAGMGQAGLLKAYPLLISAGLLGVFAYSLTTERPIIQRFAALHDRALSPQKCAYLRRLTWVWCGFLALNFTASAITWAWMSLKAWALYNGVISYLLMAALLIGEYLYRRLFLVKTLSHSEVSS